MANKHNVTKHNISQSMWVNPSNQQQLLSIDDTYILHKKLML